MSSPVVNDLAALLEQGEVCVLSGAGMSTESGIPDYRGPDGTRRVRPMEYKEFAGSAAARRRYWARAHAGWARFAAARANAGHRAVAALQHHGYLEDVITQNVDGLHQEAGAVGVLELHGTLSVVRCLDCEDRRPRTEMEQRLADANEGFADAMRGTGRVQPDGDVASPRPTWSASSFRRATSAARTVSNRTSCTSGSPCRRSASSAPTQPSTARGPCSSSARACR